MTNETKNRTTLMADDPRLIHIEGRVDRLETDVIEIKTGVQKLLDRPQNPGFTQVVSTMLATLGICGIVFGFARWHLYEAVSPLQQNIMSIEKKMDDSDRRFENERVTSAINDAIMAERSRWLEAQRGWTPRTELGNLH